MEICAANASSSADAEEKTHAGQDTEAEARSLGSATLAQATLLLAEGSLF